MSDKKNCSYEIGGKKYTQEKLVLGQIEQLIPLIEGLAFSAKPQPFEIVRSLGGRISTAISIALKKDGQELKDKDVDEQAKDLKFNMSLPMTLKVVKDFFLCNPIGSLLEDLTMAMEEIAEMVPEELTEMALSQDGSENSSSSLQKEISPSEIKSSGATPSESASHT
jgi:hypothetical protein